MKTILVPIDFSQAAKDAVDYSIQVAEHYGYEQIILLKVHYESYMDYISTMGVGYSFMGKEASIQYNKQSKLLLQAMEKRAKEQAAALPNLQVRTASSDLPLARAITAILSKEPGIELMILGSNHTKSSDPDFITSNIIKIARTAPVKILIVPEGVPYHPFEQILVPCDLQHLQYLDKLEDYKTRLKSGSKLTILNIYTRANSGEGFQVGKWQEKLKQYFEGRQLQFFDFYATNALSGVLDFVSLHPTDLIVALPGRHSFLYYMAQKSLSEGIYKNTNQPVLLLK